MTAADACAVTVPSSTRHIAIAMMRLVQNISVIIEIGSAASMILHKACVLAWIGDWNMLELPR